MSKPLSSLLVIAGPCVLENEAMAFDIAQHMKTVTDRLGLPYVFKASFDKANRTSRDSFRGPGLKQGLKIMARLKKKMKVFLLIDIYIEE